MGRETPITLSVVITCRNENVHIEDYHQSIFAQENIPGEFEIIVSDGMFGGRDLRDSKETRERRSSATNYR
jgi:hypothetical protein